MPIRWYICPVDTVQETDAGTGAVSEPKRYPRVARLINPTTLRPYAFSGAIHLADWAVVFVTVASELDFTAIAADSQCIDILEQSYESNATILGLTPVQLGWSNARLNRLRNRLEQKGVDITGLLNSTPLSEWLDRLMAVVHPSYKSSGTRAASGSALAQQIAAARLLRQGGS